MTTPTPDREALLALADEVASGRGMDNGLDVRVEIALFQPDDEYVSIRANGAGTKTVCTKHDGSQRTFWARDFTISPTARAVTAQELRALAGDRP